MENECELIFWDVQHGHAAYLRTPNDRHVVVDLGTGNYSGSDGGFSPLKHLKDNLGVDQLDFVIITHPHLDHIDDILNFDYLSPKVLKRSKHIPNEHVLDGVRESDKEKFEAYCQINNRYSLPINSDSYNCTTNPQNWGGVSIETFTPTTCDLSNYNNQSTIVVFRYEGLKVVVPGDNEQASFDELMLKPEFKNAVKDADILLAPHHGRESGYVADFVDLVNPRITVVSDGRFCDTSANHRYSNKSRGWSVFNRSDDKENTRKCLTTNSDGEIVAKFGTRSDGKKFLKITRR